MRVTALLFGFLFGSCAAGAASSKDCWVSASPSRNPVLLIHGLGDDSRSLGLLERYLRREGRDVHSLDLRPSWGQIGLDVLAEQVAAFVDERFGAKRQFDLVGYSMGGLVSRYYLQRLGGAKRVQRFVTVCTPHHGSRLAHLLPSPGIRQMRPGSEFLRDLQRDESELWKRVQFTSFWTPLDTVVVPARSAVVPGERNERIWCVAHPLMVWEPRCIRAVAGALAAPAVPSAQAVGARWRRAHPAPSGSKS